MICNKCGTNVPHGAAFCPECGKPLEKPKQKGGKLPLHTVLPWQEKPWLGVLGALLGVVLSLVSATVILLGNPSLLNRGFVGFITALMVPGLWWSLAGRIGKVGKVVCVVLSLLTGWLCNYIIWMVDYLYRYWYADMNLVDAFLGAAKILGNNAYALDYYAIEMAFVLGGVVVGLAIQFALHKGACED